MRAAVISGLMFLFMAYPARSEETVSNGEALYMQRCAQCHEAGDGHAPKIDALRLLPVERVRATLTNGIMTAQARDLTADQINQLSRFVAGTTSGDLAMPSTAFCPPAKSFTPNGPQWNGWGADLTQHRFQPAEMADLSAADVPRLKLKWAFAFPGDNRAYAQPAIIGGRLFVGSAGGKVYALDASSGCVHWVFDATFPVRTAMTVGPNGGGTVYFADQRANAFAVDATSGKQLWKTHVDDHTYAIVTGSPVLVGPVLFVPIASTEEIYAANPQYGCCTFRGSVAALDAATGAVLQKSYTVAELPKPTRKNEKGVQLLGPSGAGVWSSPTVDVAKRMIYVTTGDSYSDPVVETSDAILAYHMDTGALAWSRETLPGDGWNWSCLSPTPVNCPEAKGPDLDFAASAILVETAGGKRVLVAAQKTGVVFGLDPDRQGEILWQKRVGEGADHGGVQWGIAADDERVYVAVSDLKRRRVKAGTAERQASVFDARFDLNPDAGGGLYALKPQTGEVLWHTPHPSCGGVPGCSPAQPAAVTAIPGIVFSGSVDGHLRAYAAADGRIVWDVDTKADYPTVNGIPGRGGSLDGPGAVVVGGMVYVNSGYGFIGEKPGNVLLAFSVDGK